MFTPEMLASVKKVEATRQERLPFKRKGAKARTLKSRHIIAKIRNFLKRYRASRKLHIRF